MIAAHRQIARRLTEQPICLDLEDRRGLPRGDPIRRAREHRKPGPGRRHRLATEDQVADRLAELRRHGVERRHAEGNFSLPGAQPKTALVCLDGRWGVPSGRLPTTYILKPPIDDLEGHAENEVFCLALARKLDLAAAEADVLRFRDEIAISVKRYDRASRGNGFVRVHQEDMCQAMSVPPADKDERDGGPGIRAIMRLLAWSTNPGQDRIRFMDAIALNFLILNGSDAHAKNYSLLFGPPRRPGASWEVRLAPLYDVASYLPYATRLEDIRMPMKVGQHRHYEEILPRHWEQMSVSCDTIRRIRPSSRSSTCRKHTRRRRRGRRRSARQGH